jgi:hypothetical protein
MSVISGRWCSWSAPAHNSLTSRNREEYEIKQGNWIQITYRLVTIVYYYNYHNSIYYPSSCLRFKTMKPVYETPWFKWKTRRWAMSGILTVILMVQSLYNILWDFALNSQRVLLNGGSDFIPPSARTDDSSSEVETCVQNRHRPRHASNWKVLIGVKKNRSSGGVVWVPRNSRQLYRYCTSSPSYLLTFAIFAYYKSRISSFNFRIFVSPYLRIFSLSYLLTFAPSHLYNFFSSPVLTFASLHPSHLRICTSFCLRIFSLSLHVHF